MKKLALIGMILFDVLALSCNGFGVFGFGLLGINLISYFNFSMGGFALALACGLGTSYCVVGVHRDVLRLSNHVRQLILKLANLEGK